MSERPVAALVYWRFSDGVPHGGDARARALLLALTEAGFQVQKIPVSGAAYVQGSSAASKLIQAFKRALFPLPFRRRKALAAVGRNLHACAPELVVGCVPHVHRLCLDVGARAVWLDYFDSWAEMGRQEAKFSVKLARPIVATQAALWKHRESREAPRADAVTFAGYGDWRRSGLANAIWLPTPVVQRPSDRRIAAPRRGKPTAGIIANWDYWPNADAWTIFTTSWLPTLRRAGWPVLVAGLGSNELQETPGVKIIGAVEDLAEFYDAIDVALVPVRRGGGIKVKALEALLWGKPVLADGHVLDGFPQELGRYIRVFDPACLPSPNAFESVPDDLLDLFQPERFTSEVIRVVTSVE